MNATAAKSDPTPAIRAEDLRKFMRRCAPSTDETRQHLCSLHFEGGQVITTDGHRLHRVPAPRGLGLLEATVPTWALDAALRACSDSARITIRQDRDQVVLEFDGGAISAIPAKAGGKTFVPWEAVHPLHDGRSGAPRLEADLPLTAAIRELKRLRQHGDALVLSGLLYAPADGNSRDVVRFHARKMPSPHRPLENPPAPWDLEPAPEWNGQVGLQADYLLEALAAAKHTLGADARLKGAAVTLRVWGELDPVLVSWTDGDAVIMPCRVS